MSPTECSYFQEGNPVELLLNLTETKAKSTQKFPPPLLML